MRIVHLIDAASPQASATTLALIAQSFGRLGDIDQHLVLAGGTPLARAAAAVGLKVGEQVTKISAPYGKSYLAYPAIRKALRRLGDIDIVHCWSIGSLSTAAILARCKRTLTTVTVAPTSDQLRWLRVMTGDSSIASSGTHHLLPISATLAGDLISSGVDQSLVHVLRPGIDMGMVEHGQRETLQNKWRQQMRVSDGVDGEVKFVAMLSDPCTATNTSDLAMTAALAEDSRHDDPTKIVLVVNPGQHNRYRAKQMLAELDRPGHVIEEPLTDQPWKVLPGCDIAIAIQPGAGGLSLLWAMASNIPIVGEACYAVSEILEDHHSALLAHPPQPKQLAHQIRLLMDDEQLAYRLRDTARHEAYSFFSRSQYCKGLQTAYEQVIADQPIELPQMESTGGLRFTGRG